MIAPARNLGKYEIRQKLGRGGMADVYLAVDTEQGHLLALKLIEHADDADTRDSIEAERRGAELQGQLAAVDGHVAHIYESGDMDGYFYVAMEYVEGQDLSERMRSGGRPQTLPVEFAVDVAIAVAGTLESAHNLEVNIGGKSFRGIVHGDIKPKNIRIDTRGEVRVLDFGIAKALSLSRKLTRNEFGSVPYTSPERLLAGEVNFQSDLWSLAVMLYEMVTGLQPYQADTTERLERMIRSRIPPPPAPDPCPDALRRILVKAMMPEPELRYPSARDFADDLIMFRTGGPVRAVSEDTDATRRTLAAERDMDETRRTGAAETDAEATRRTAPAAAAAAAGAKTPDEILNWPPKSIPVRKPRRVLRRAILYTTVAGLAFAGWQSLSGYLLYKRAQKLETAIETEQVTSPADIWSEWTELSKDNPSSLYLRGARQAVKTRMVEAADRVISSYRNTGAVYENGWKGAREELMHALSLGPDESVRGKLRLAEGHVSRIAGEARHRQTDLNDALEKFDEAEHLLPASPDPPLAEARLELESQQDFDRAYNELELAEKHGYAGKSERGELADDYRDRANREFWSSRDVRDLPQEKDLVTRARDDYQRAMDLYRSIVPYGNSAASIQTVEESLDSVNFRLNAIEHPPAEPITPRGILDRLRHIWR
jgi:tetratricopeptide (TPR) repeat protein